MKKLTEKEINDLFSSCLFEENELVNGKPTTPITSVKATIPNSKGEIPVIAFSTNKLNQNKNRIIKLIERLPDLENGAYLETLLYDSTGNKWCTDIKCLDKLIMMGIAANTINKTIVEYKNRKVEIITRTKHKDSEPVTGIIIGHQYTQEELKIIEENKKRIIQELRRYINTIQTGFNLLGITVQRDSTHENILHFYDKTGNLIATKKYEDTEGLIGPESFLGLHLTTEFTTKDNTTYYYSFDKNRHLFLKNTPTTGYRIEITTTQTPIPKIEHLMICTTDKNADYKIKRITIDKKSLHIELNNQFGPYGNYVDGEKRELWYKNDPNENPYHWSFILTEQEWYDKGHYLTGEQNGFRLDNKNITSELSPRQFYNLTTRLVQHPRTQELIEYTVSEIDKELPGTRSFITKNFSLFNTLTDTSTYEDNPIINAIIDATTHEKCNLPPTPIQKQKKDDLN